LTIGLPPIIQNNINNKELKDKVINDNLNGINLICLAISEPYAGSDVKGMRLTATLDKNDNN